ncbi:hypothetical protein A3B21_05260 [Candidatus Uhrbacteria bacterium RIFCSPLOWO2_01_FULL_47_24]|uniref:SprT-like domain-containing protein n=1 Tax=Candidatus Uhrbacteria bacterium RIFCSPLOWO2_01_FULL_47_24 TaxID=1802401 RepID=A0A1F7UUX6_9BACT|nr:MAG: hypothetical protein A2753_03300 [Candidatus Uhrbacteria bacterium RIFCSPHIGHO2_01_FULL_47_11]OGL68416.1 MAG: hypothetical protein A3D58_03925 [Candidatus Uhrbacteria bacterium RIFCSPHIGHO2_02_FULL_46_47]OGL75873.1 MAG: hypothetical protein A3F52_03520 [Candidatus Uhrbacteria bacterium RIFCSPHIGHO2_12_FULL_47_11]OGL82091.1 MAG: hypothetical protein A3B21_05260 [Candidatus Uhrbacteria bacterium RIFCSPLOWO2_01_FULL_47_24]OGL85486.1 MAG: hypothetical protein A3J03_05430 [Candidatus Uhrbact
MIANKQSVQRTSAEILAWRLKPHLTRELELVITGSSRTVIFVRRTPEKLKARVHAIFTNASQEVIWALASYLERADRVASRELDAYIRTNDHMFNGGREGKIVGRVLSAKGRCHDLAEILEAVDAEYFGGTLNANITWNEHCRAKGPRNSLRLGSCVVQERLIRIHPRLDQKYVPRYYLASIVHHEALHLIHGVKRVSGRRQFHPPAFTRDERRFRERPQALIWAYRNQHRLFR